MPGALIGEFPDTEDLRLEGGADGVEQIRERPIAGAFAGSAARGLYAPKIGEIMLNSRCCIFAGHSIPRFQLDEVRAAVPAFRGYVSAPPTCSRFHQGQRANCAAPKAHPLLMVGAKARMLRLGMACKPFF